MRPLRKSAGPGFNSGFELNRLDNWVPIRIVWQNSQPMVDWCRLGQLRFTEPFFDQTINRALAHPANLLFQRRTPIEELGQLAVAHPGLTPSGFIFHMSRCGSTLISQMLAAAPENVVISEARPIDSVLRGHFSAAGIAEEQRIRWLQWLVSALGQVRHPEQKRFFIKFDSWHALFLPLIRRAFPAVPWIFVYRQPAEVLASHWRQRGPQVIPGVLEAALFGWAQSAVDAMSPEEYAARVLRRFCEAASESVQTGGGRLVNYQQLPDVVLAALLEFWGLAYSQTEREQMLKASRLNAKNPFVPFEKDAGSKKQNAAENLRGVVQQWLEEPYRRLEQLRTRLGFH